VRPSSSSIGPFFDVGTVLRPLGTTVHVMQSLFNAENTWFLPIIALSKVIDYI